MTTEKDFVRLSLPQREGIRVLEAVGAKYGVEFEWQGFPWGCDWYKQHGKMCPDDAPQILRRFDAVYFGAVGNPAIVADHISAWGLLINFRRWFDLYVNLRPVRLLPGIDSPLKAEAGEIDYVIVRENTEGLYLSRGKGVGNDQAMADTLLVTRKGVERAARYAFELARRRAASTSNSALKPMPASTAKAGTTNRKCRRPVSAGP